MIFIISFKIKKQKIKYIKQHKIVVVNCKSQTSNFLFRNYGIPIDIKKSGLVEIIFPDLDNESQLLYHYRWYHLSEVYIAELAVSYSKTKEFKIIQNLNSYVQENLKIENEITDMHSQYEKIYELTVLVAKSELYSNQLEIYDKALIQITKQIDKGKQLHRLYRRIIKEKLIGAKIANLNPDMINDNYIIQQTKYKQLKEEYKYMKDKVEAYQFLIGNNH